MSLESEIPCLATVIFLLLSVVVSFTFIYVTLCKFTFQENFRMKQVTYF